MLTSFYALRALADEWHRLLAGAMISSAYSQHADELSVEFARGDTTWTLRARFAGKLRFVLLDERAARARRNVATVLGSIAGARLRTVRIADRDRILYFDLDDGRSLVVTLFGGGANAFLVDSRGSLLETFRGQAGDPAVPRATPAPDVDSFASDAHDLWAAALDGGGARVEVSTARLVSRLYPLMNEVMAKECVHRSGTQPMARDVDAEGVTAIVREIRSLEAEALRAEARIYLDGDRPVHVSLVELRHAPDLREKKSSSVTEAVGEFVRMSLRWARFDEEYVPLRRAVERELKRERKRLRDLTRVINESGRAEEYERIGHVLMASPNARIPDSPADGTVGIEVDDPFVAERRTIKVVPGMSMVENAQRYYEKARSARQAVEAALGRHESSAARERELSELGGILRDVRDPASWRETSKLHAERFNAFRDADSPSGPQVPFRRFKLDGGYEVWVGKNARQNDELTTRAARKFDLWLHARGVGGSHVLLRPPGRVDSVPERFVEQAASVAAYYSKARGSSIVPVVVAERKFVRKPKKAPPGTVLLDRHRVIMVEPGLPT